MDMHTGIDQMKNPVPPGYSVISGRMDETLNAYLGTCVGVALCDIRADVGGLIHLILAEPTDISNCSNPASSSETKPARTSKLRPPSHWSRRGRQQIGCGQESRADRGGPVRRLSQPGMQGGDADARQSGELLLRQLAPAVVLKHLFPLNGSSMFANHCQVLHRRHSAIAGAVVKDASFDDLPAIASQPVLQDFNDQLTHQVPILG